MSTDRVLKLQRLGCRRRALGMSMCEAARLLGVEHRCIGRWESGEHIPDISRVRRYAALICDCEHGKREYRKTSLRARNLDPDRDIREIIPLEQVRKLEAVRKSRRITGCALSEQLGRHKGFWYQLTHGIIYCYEDTYNEACRIIYNQV